MDNRKVLGNFIIYCHFYSILYY